MENTNNEHLPPPKFKKGQIVYYNRDKVNDIIERCKNIQGTGQLPTYKLRISEDPRWNNKIKQWIYSYEYGFTMTSEGSAQEKDLIS
tara:strand:- start:244 stop:504 length:261 start_codon:yes stop_codon:yes gene_type:complete